MGAETPIELHEAVPLAPLTTIGVGGAARWMTTATTPSQVGHACAWAHARGVPLFVLGGGSNIIVADEGFPGLVIRIGIRGLEYERDADATQVRAGAGESWDSLVSGAVARGLAGIECLSGIPGTVGGTPIQNVGAYGQEVSETIAAITAFDRNAGRFVELPVGACGFAYRMSRFKTEPDRFIVTGVTYRLRMGEPRVRYPDLQSQLHRAGVEQPSLANVRDAVIALRRAKGMVLDPLDADSRSVGSFFMNPIVPVPVRGDIARIAGDTPPTFAAETDRVKIPAAWLIERAGFPKGITDGAVATSSKHPLAIVNRGGATTRDVLRLAVRIKKQVADRFGLTLRTEPIFVGFTDDPDVTYLRGS